MIHYNRMNFAALMDNGNEYIIRAYDSHEAAEQATTLADLMDEQLKDVHKL